MLSPFPSWPTTAICSVAGGYLFVKRFRLGNPTFLILCVRQRGRPQIGHDGTSSDGQKLSHPVSPFHWNSEYHCPYGSGVIVCRQHTPRIGHVLLEHIDDMVILYSRRYRAYILSAQRKQRRSLLDFFSIYFALLLCQASNQRDRTDVYLLYRHT